MSEDSDKPAELSSGMSEANRPREKWRNFEIHVGRFMESRAWLPSALKVTVGVFVATAPVALYLAADGWQPLLMLIVGLLPIPLVFLNVIYQRDVEQRAKESAESSRKQYEAGYSEALGKWRVSSNIVAGAEARMYRHLHHLVRHIVRRDPRLGNPPIAEVTGEAIVGNLLQILREKIKSILDADVINANLMLFDKGKRRNHLIVVCFDAETENRTPGRKLRYYGDQHAAKLKEFGATTAFRTREPQYVPDAAVLDIERRPYGSILSFPVLCGCGRHAIGIVNVDSPHKDGFPDMGNLDDLEALYLACSDIIRLIGLVLLDVQCFRSLANRGYKKGADNVR